MGERPGALGVHRERKIAARLEDHFLGAEPVSAEQIVGLVEAVLPQRGCGGGALQRGVLDGPKGAEMGVMNAPAGAQPAHRVEDGAIGVGGGADHELHGHSRGAAGVEQVARLALRPLRPLAEQLRPDSFEIGYGGAEALLGRDLGEAGPAGRLEVDRDPARELGQPLDLRGLAAGHELHMDVPAEAVPLAQQLQRGDEIVHDLHRPARDAGRDEQPFAPPPLAGAEEDADELLRLEQGPGHVAVAAHRAIVAVVAAGVGHEDPEQRHAHPGHRPQVPDVERPQRADLTRVPQARRQALAVVGGE